MSHFVDVKPAAGGANRESACEAVVEKAVEHDTVGPHVGIRCVEAKQLATNIVVLLQRIRFSIEFQLKFVSATLSFNNSRKSEPDDRFYNFSPGIRLI